MNLIKKKVPGCRQINFIPAQTSTVEEQNRLFTAASIKHLVFLVGWFLWFWCGFFGCFLADRFAFHIMKCSVGFVSTFFASLLFSCFILPA